MKKWTASYNQRKKANEISREYKNNSPDDFFIFIPLKYPQKNKNISVDSSPKKQNKAKKFNANAFFS